MLEKLANDIAWEAMEKLALNAMKARGLAKSVGLIPQAGSDWKWALRNMRAANPAGVKNAPSMQTGRDLAVSKQRIGALPNNSVQKIKSQARSTGNNGVEVGLTDSGSAVVGQAGTIANAGGVRAHTHPGNNAYTNAQRVKKSPSAEISRMSDPVMAASPSGWVGTRGKVPTSTQLAQKRQKAVGEISRSSEISMDEAGKYVQQVGQKPDMMAAARTVSPTLASMSPMQAGWVAGAKLPWKGDMGLFANRGGVNNILTPNVQGVHKVRPKHTDHLRSVYFNGGYM